MMAPVLAPEKVNSSTRNALAIEALLVVLFVASFAGLAARKIGFYPPPWKDESWLMQPAYEVVRQGRMCLPMFRHLGSEVGERVLTDPAFNYLLAGWFRFFGFGIREARLFNLTLSVGVLLLVYLIGRRWGGRWAGAVAMVLLVFDNNYFTGSRFLRNDFAALFFALGAAYCYLQARGRWGWLVAAGLSAALAALSHLNGVYVIALLGLWLLVDHGWRAVKKREAWLVAAGVMILLLPYGAYCLRHRDIYVAQWKLFTPGRERGVTAEGLWSNILDESGRYQDWQYGVMTMTSNRAVLFFQIFTVIALAYLLATTARRLWRREPLAGEPRTAGLIAAFWCVIFFASEVTNKTSSYLPHLTTWFALAVGITASDLVMKMGTWRRATAAGSWQHALALSAAGVLIAIALVYFNGALVLTLKYNKYMSTLEPTSYESMRNAFAETIGPELVPVGSPRHWYLFAARDDFRAFSRPLSRRILKGELDGEQYAMIVNEKERRKFLNVAGDVEAPARRFNLLAELPSTPYGPLWIYYIGTDPNYLGRSARRF